MTKTPKAAQNAPRPATIQRLTPPGLDLPKPPASAPRVIGDLAPSLTPEEVDRGHWYWCGALPEAPQSNIDCAGIGFAKVTQTIRHRNTMGTVERTSQAGAVVRLTDAQLELLAERLRHRVVRPTSAQGAAAETGAGVVLDEAPKGQRGIIMTLPTAEDEAAAKRRGRPCKRFVARAGDRPLADFLYLVPLEEPSPRPRPIDTPLPEPLSVTGIRFNPGAVVDEGAKVAGTDDGLAAINASLQPKARSMLREIDDRENAVGRLLQ